MYETGEDFDSKSMDAIERKSFDRLFGNDTNIGFSDLSSMVSPRLLKSIYQSEDWVYILVDRIASKLAQIPWQVHQRIVRDGEEILEPALQHPVQKMLDDPNPLQPSYAFKYALIADLCITGNALVFISRVNRWLVQVPTEIIWMDITGGGDLRGYDIVGVDPMSFPVGMRTKLKVQDVAHVKRPNPSSVFWGLSPLIPGASPALFNKYSNEYLLNFYKKGAQPGIVLTMSDEANAEQAKKLLGSLEASYTGRSNQRRGLILPKGVKADSLAHTLADQQLIEYIRNNRETLIAIYGVPKQELSIQDQGGGLGSEEYKTALKNFWEGPLMSIGGMFETVLTQRLGSLLGSNYLIKLNYSNVPVLQDDLLQKANVGQAMLATMTVNEVRNRIWKLPPIEGGDVIPSLNQPSFPSFGSQLSTPNTGETLELSAPQIDQKKANFDAFVNYVKSEDNSWFREQQDRVQAESEKNMSKIEELWLKLLEDQVVAAVKVAKDQMKEKSVEVPSKRKLKRDIDAAMDEVEDQWRDGYVDYLDAQVELGYDAVLNAPFNEPYKEAIEAIRARTRDKRRETLAARALESFDQMSSTSTEKIMNVIEQGMKDNRSILEIAESIRDVAKIGIGRAATIARTETLIASSIGEAAAREDAVTVIPKLVKVWINANDNRVRGRPGGLYEDSQTDHWVLLGEIVDEGDTFSNGLRYPRDTKGPANEVINCRCSLLSVSEDDLPQLGLKR